MFALKIFPEKCTLQTISRKKRPSKRPAWYRGTTKCAPTIYVGTRLILAFMCGCLRYLLLSVALSAHTFSIVDKGALNLNLLCSKSAFRQIEIICPYKIIPALLFLGDAAQKLFFFICMLARNWKKFAHYFSLSILCPWFQVKSWHEC